MQVTQPHRHVTSVRNVNRSRTSQTEPSQVSPTPSTPTLYLNYHLQPSRAPPCMPRHGLTLAQVSPPPLENVPAPHPMSPAPITCHALPKASPLPNTSNTSVYHLSPSPTITMNHVMAECKLGMPASPEPPPCPPKPPPTSSATRQTPNNHHRPSSPSPAISTCHVMAQ
jgi:hypothetical protein